MICSMSRKGNCWDNAPTESWFNSFKNERVHGVRYTSHAEMKSETFEYIEVFYNRKRMHSTLGKSPIECKRSTLPPCPSANQSYEVLSGRSSSIRL